VSSLLVPSYQKADSWSRSDQPGNRITGSTLLTALALSDDNLLAVLSKARVLQRVELSLHSAKILAIGDTTWHLVLRAVHDLQLVLTSLLPLPSFLDKAYSTELVLDTWHNITSNALVLSAKLRWAVARHVRASELII
jgi:hypothetical protein